jgi:hypothetical protein
VAVFWIVTVTPGSTACCASLTTPSTENVGVCANEPMGVRSEVHSAKSAQRQTNERLMGYLQELTSQLMLCWNAGW